MRVLLTHRPGGAYGYISDGWQNAFRSMGWQAERWDGSEEMWQSFKPNLYMGCSSHRQPIPSYNVRNCKIAIHVNPYGVTDIPGINESHDNIKWTVAQYPDAVFGYGLRSDAHFWGNWTNKHAIQWVPMACAADVTLFNSTQPKLYDLAYVGGRWPYKATRLDKWLLPLLARSGLSYKLHGFGDWPGVQCLPSIPHEQVGRVLGRARVGPCVNEPHIAQYGFDLAERPFKVAMSGTLVVHDKVVGLERFLPNAVIAEDPEHFRLLCEYYSRAGDDVVRDIVDKQRKDVLSAHTYHHRLIGLLESLDFSSAAAEMQTYTRSLN